MQYYNFFYFCVCLNFNIIYAYNKCEVPENVGDIGKHRDNLEMDCEASSDEKGYQRY